MRFRKPWLSGMTETSLTTAGVRPDVDAALEDARADGEQQGRWTSIRSFSSRF